MYHSPLMKIVGMGSWLITALASINMGLMPFGYDFFRSDFVMNNMANLVVPMLYLIGLAGVVSFALLVMAFTNHCKCNSANCKC